MPPECLHIGDHQQQDIAAAHRLGMKTIWVNLGDAPWTEESCRPDQEITHLAQLPAAVQVLADRNTEPPGPRSSDRAGRLP